MLSPPTTMQPCNRYRSVGGVVLSLQNACTSALLDGVARRRPGDAAADPLSARASGGAGFPLRQDPRAGRIPSGTASTIRCRTLR